MATHELPEARDERRVTIERLQRSHVPAVARLHGASLEGLLADLGPVATRVYYAACAESPHAIGLVALRGKVVSGFVLGSKSPAELQRDVIRRKPLGVALGIALGVLRRPRTLRWVMQSVSAADARPHDPSTAELIYLAVSSEGRRAGVGRRLVDAFAEAMRAAHQKRFELSVDQANRDAITFYERLGFWRIGDYEEFGRRRVRFAATISSTPSPVR